MRHLSLSAERNIIECGRPAEDKARKFAYKCWRTDEENLISIYRGIKYREESGELGVSFCGFI